MKTQFNSLVQILTATGLVCIFQACSGGFGAIQTLTSETTKPQEVILEGDASLFLKFQGVVSQHCTKCHGASDSPFGGIADFTQLQTQQDWLASPRQVIVAGSPKESPMYNRLVFAKGKVANTNNNMPFALSGEAPTMTEADAQVVYDYINSVQAQANPLASCDESYSAGDVQMRRLNVAEIRNSLRDIFGVEDAFPTLPEATAGQFSNIGKFQTLDDSFFNFYSEGVDQVSDQIASQYSSQISNCNKGLDCILNLLNPLAELAYRKRLTTEDRNTYRRAMESLLNNSAYSFSGEDAFVAGLQSILLNPQFLYVTREGDGSGERNYTDFELATRISLTLFASIPDRSLWTKANSGELQRNYEQVIDDLMSSDRFANRFVDQFSEGWLGLSKIDGLTPNSADYGLSTNEFRPIGNAMKESVRLSLRHALLQDQSVDVLAVGSQRFLNSDLATHLGVDGSYNSSFKLVNLPNSSPYANTGLLTTSPLVSTSLSDRESIVFRGVQVLGAFTCKVPPPPPDDVMAEIEEMSFPAGTSQRDMLEQHSNDSRCASCHAIFDPYGFGLNAFDGLGRFRLQDQHGNPIDASGSIDSVTFADHKEMAKTLVAKNNFKKCVSQTLLTYAIGKEFNPIGNQPDMCTVNRVVAEAKSGSLRETLKKVLMNRYFKTWLDQ